VGVQNIRVSDFAKDRKGCSQRRTLLFAAPWNASRS
jgi:hypothetical protein